MQCITCFTFLLQMRHDDTATSLFMVVADLLSSRQSHQTANDKTQIMLPANQATVGLTNFADNILSKRSKSLHAQLGSTVRKRVNAATWLLAAIANIGTHVTTHLMESLDMTSDAFSKLAHPPK